MNNQTQKQHPSSGSWMTQSTIHKRNVDRIRRIQQRQQQVSKHQHGLQIPVMLRIWRQVFTARRNLSSSLSSMQLESVSASSSDHVYDCDNAMSADLFSEPATLYFSDDTTQFLSYDEKLSYSLVKNNNAITPLSSVGTTLSFLSNHTISFVVIVGSSIIGSSKLLSALKESTKYPYHHHMPSNFVYPSYALELATKGGERYNFNATFNALADHYNIPKWTRWYQHRHTKPLILLFSFLGAYKVISVSLNSPSSLK